MLSRFDFLSPRQVVFGWGRRVELPALVKNLGTHAWVICGSRTLIKNGVIAEIEELLKSVGCVCHLLHTQIGEPTVADVDNVTAQLRLQLNQLGSATGHWVLGIGGGSAIDMAKAVAAMLTNAQGASVAEFLEGIGTGKTITNPPLPVVAMPTTAGTGSEATKNAVITSLQPAAKKSLRSPLMVPSLVLLDPELCTSAPPQVIAYSGMDAITQLIESYVSKFATVHSRAFVTSSMMRVIPHLKAACTDNTNKSAFAALSYAAYCSGLALANSGLGMAHGVAAGLGAICNVPHGLACAVMLPVTLRTNFEACKDGFEYLNALDGYSYGHEAQDLIESIDKLCNTLKIPKSLSELNVRRDQIPDLVKASQGNSMNGNPEPISEEKLTEILEKML